MISKHEQKQLKRFLGAQYSKRVLDILSHKGIKNKQGKPHTAAYIRMVFQGLRNNAEIENAIWELANQNKDVLFKRRHLKKKVLGSR